MLKYYSIITYAHSIRNTLMANFLDSVLDLIFPTKCMLCRAPGAELCHLCLGEAPTAERESAEWIFPLYDYRHPPVKKALHLFKYKGKKRLANIFAKSIYGKISEELSDLGVMENFINPVLIPIPLSGKRYRERGYNQAELICRKLVEINPDFKLENNILIKPKDTEHQARIKDRRARLENIVGSFAVKNEHLIKNRNIILIDDITTTGATLNEARKVLKRLGARKIIA